jgi:MMP 1-O-methyltransferase
MTPRAVAVARATKGFMPEDEGQALHEAGLDGGRVGPLLEIGSYCGKSAVYLGSAAQEIGTVLFTIDHHHGSEENQAGWEHHDPEVVDPRTSRMDTLPFFRRTIEDAGLEDAVVAVVGDSPTVAKLRSGSGSGPSPTASRRSRPPEASVPSAASCTRPGRW